MWGWDVVTHFDFFLMSGRLLALRLDSLLEIIKSDGEGRNIAGYYITLGITCTYIWEFDNYHVGSGFSRTAFCHKASFVAFAGRPYMCT